MYLNEDSLFDLKEATEKTVKREFAVLRTHGGLGNQLFQVLFGRLFAEQRGLVLCEVHDLRYRHKFSRSVALARSGEPSAWQRWISAARIPKLLERACGRPEEPLRLGHSFYLDGYFQRAENYAQFPDDVVGRQLQRLANELAIEPANLESWLVHLRLGDFFTNRTAALLHVKERLAKVPQGAHVMTNDETLLRDPEVVELMAARSAELVSTNDMPAEQVLRTMARYRRIDANDSTLTFWSSVLGGCEVVLRDQRLRDCRDLLARRRSGF